MKLYDYLEKMPEGEELTVWDIDYDTEFYFYSQDPADMDDWDNAMMELSKLLTITEIRTNGVTVNLSEIIEKHLDNDGMDDLFYDVDIDEIMDDIHNIIAGNVSEKWIKKFVNILKN